MSRRTRDDEKRLEMVELPRFAAMSAASRIRDEVLPEVQRILQAVEAQRRECGDTPFLRVIANAAEIARRDLAKVIEDILLWAERDAQRYGYPYGRK